MAAERDDDQPPLLSQPSSSAAAVNLPPRMQWVYNSNHTDPLNFGYMFPVVAGFQIGNPSPSSHGETFNVLPAKEQSKSVGSSPTGTASSSGPIGNPPLLLARDSPDPRAEVERQLRFSAAGSDHGYQLWAPSTPQNSASTSNQFQDPVLQDLPYRYSPESNSPQVPSTRKIVGVKEQSWIPMQSPYGPQVYHDLSLSNSQDWLQGEGRSVSNSFTSPVPSGLVLAQDLGLAAPTPLKRKRDSDFSSYVAMPLAGTDASQKMYAKGRSRLSEGLLGESILCVRCQRYQRIQMYEGLCSSCLQISFLAQPSTLGTRNENLESMVLFLAPSHMEDVMMLAPPDIPRSRSWRVVPKQSDHREYDCSTLAFQDRWTLSIQQAESTGLFGDDYGQLANIAQLYQRSSLRPNKSLEASCTVLIAVCELYKSLVVTPGSAPMSPTISIPKLINNIRTARTTIRRAFQQLQALTTSPSDLRDRQDWFPSFLSACIMAVTAVIYLDILIACPSPYREQIWGRSWHDRIAEMRSGGYGMIVGLLRANSKGVNPLKLDCWTDDAAPNPFINVTPSSYSPDNISPSDRGRKRRRANQLDAERERDILLGINSPAALQGVLALKAWYLRYSDHLRQGEDMFSKSLYQLTTMSPIAGLWRIFELQ